MSTSLLLAGYGCGRDISGKYMKNTQGWGSGLMRFRVCGLEPRGTADEVLIIHVVPWKLDLGVAWAPSFGKVDKFVKLYCCRLSRYYYNV